MTTVEHSGTHGAAVDRRRLLILDDDELVGLLVETVARLAGAEVRLTREPADFFAAIDERWPTHIVLDLTMPLMSGEQVLQALAERGCPARIVVTSGADRSRLDAALNRAGDAGLHLAGGLPKPFTPAALRALIA